MSLLYQSDLSDETTDLRLKSINRGIRDEAIAYADEQYGKTQIPHENAMQRYFVARYCFYLKVCRERCY